MKRVYVAHPFKGDDKNREKVEELIKGFVKEDSDTLYVSPLHATGFLYNEMSYENGMDHCFELLGLCDELWLCGDWRSSKGCNMEYAFALGRGIDIVDKEDKGWSL